MLRISNLTKYFGDFKALDKVNLSVEQGQIFGLIGSNGCGKSTLLNHISSVYTQDEGKIEFSDKIKKSDFYYVQDSLYFPANSTLLSMYQYEKICYPNMSYKKLVKYSELFSINLKDSLTKLSKGQKKQAAFILAMASSPKFLLLDEIVDGLDAFVKKKFWSVIIDEVSQNNLTVFLTSHDLKEIDNICDKIAIMHKGQIVREENLDTYKESMTRVQFAIKGEFTLTSTEKYKLSNIINYGSVITMIVKGDVDKFKEDLHAHYQVLIFDVLPINLEEIFITELKEVDHNA